MRLLHCGITHTQLLLKARCLALHTVSHSHLVCLVLNPRNHIHPLSLLHILPLAMRTRSRQQVTERPVCRHCRPLHHKAAGALSVHTHQHLHLPHHLKAHQTRPRYTLSKLFRLSVLLRKTQLLHFMAKTARLYNLRLPRFSETHMWPATGNLCSISTHSTPTTLHLGMSHRWAVILITNTASSNSSNSSTITITTMEAMNTMFIVKCTDLQKKSFMGASRQNRQNSRKEDSSRAPRMLTRRSIGFLRSWRRRLADDGRPFYATRELLKPSTIEKAWHKDHCRSGCSIALVFATLRSCWRNLMTCLSDFAAWSRYSMLGPFRET